MTRTPRDHPDAPGPGFEAAFALIDDIPGWLTRAQAARLHHEASLVPPGGTAVEIGSHFGRSAVVTALGLPAGARLVAIDPFGAAWRYGTSETEAGFRANLARAHVTDRVEVRVQTSREALRSWDTPVDLVYVDGKHDAFSLIHDMGWSAHLRPGATILVHDSFSSLGVTLGILFRLLGSRRLRYTGRDGSLARFEVGRPRVGDRVRMLAQLPWFARNLFIKVLLRLRLTPLAARLGHHDPADPY